MDCSTPGFPVQHQLPELTQTHVHQVSDPIQPSHPLSSLLLLLSIFPSIRVFSNESVLCIRWPKYWISICPSNENSGLISFRVDWLDLLAVQGTLKESSPTPQFKSINSSTQLMSIMSVMPSNHLILCRPFYSCLQSFPASGSFQMSKLFTSGGQNIGASA